MTDAASHDVTRDAFFGGRLILDQPVKGHRSGTDAVLLAAAVPRDFGGLVCDVGAGVGAAGLGVAMLCPMTRLRLIERDAAIAELARGNVVLNGMVDRVDVTACDVLDKAERRDLAGCARLVITNPPFYHADRVRASPVAGRRDAHVADAELATWLDACLDLLEAKGTLVLIHEAAALAEILAALGVRAGAVTLLMVHPRKDRSARRVLVRAIKGSRAPLSVAAPLVLHGDDGFEPEAERLHLGKAMLQW